MPTHNKAFSTHKTLKPSGIYGLNPTRMMNCIGTWSCAFNAFPQNLSNFHHYTFGIL